ncbi:alpha/beta hydrolase [Nocardiopsis sp. RSe5-2]|uniref:Alpha/beta hydrolase n=1 Tax=Nocardiopsis endophytica TaxID=3018445 RepID=A0ABT4U539_9ACTN|nr:alpha/beta hydrolase [Nocardiopsis endophytica]MDA2811565.1 alpha/beta hydrolase [Nocardiopsis endophytica]
MTMLSLDDGDIHIRQDGPGDAPALLLLHGTASSTRCWDTLVPELRGAHRVLRSDLLGHGRSGEPSAGGYAVPRQARRVGRALDLLGVGRVVAVGHSSGGAVATALAEERPGLVAGIVLIGTGPRPAAFTGAQAPAIGPDDWPPPEEAIRALVAAGFARADTPVPQELVDDARGMSHRAFTESMRATTEYMEQEALPERLARRGVPLTVVFGDRDPRWRPASAAEYRAVPGARVHMLPGVGHFPFIEDRARTAALLADAAGKANVTPQ